MSSRLKPSQSLRQFCVKMGWNSSDLAKARKLKWLSLRLASQMAVCLKVSLPNFLRDLSLEQGIPRRRPILASEFYRSKERMEKKKRTRRRHKNKAIGKPVVVRCTVCRSERHNRMSCPYREGMTPQMALAKARAEATHGGQR